MLEILDSLNNIIMQNIYIAPIIALISGMIVAFLPCSLSSLPLLIFYLSGENKKNAFKYSIFYALGSTIIFVVLGILASIIGKSFNLMNDYIYIFFGILMLILALFMLGIIKIPQFKVLKKVQDKKKNKSVFLGILLGIVSGIFSSPCSTPVLLGILAIVTTSQNIFFGIILLLFYGIGNGIVQIVFGSFINITDKLVNSKKYEIIGKILNIITIIFVLSLSFYMFYLGF